MNTYVAISRVLTVAFLGLYALRYVGLYGRQQPVHAVTLVVISGLLIAGITVVDFDPLGFAVFIGVYLVTVIRLPHRREARDAAMAARRGGTPSD